MKRTEKILAALMVLFSALFMTSCDLLSELAGELGPKDEWYVFDKEFDAGNGQKLMVQVWAYYSESGYVNKNMRSEVKIGEGLTFLVLPDTASKTNDDSVIASVFGNVADGVNPVAVKTFAPGESLSDNIPGMDNVVVNDKLWATLYLAYIGKNAEAYDDGCPTAISKRTVNAYTLVDEDFSWSTFLKQILAANILSKL